MKNFHERQLIELNMGMVDFIRKDEVCSAIIKIKNKNAIGPDGIVIEVWKVLGRY